MTVSIYTPRPKSQEVKNSPKTSSQHIASDSQTNNQINHQGTHSDSLNTTKKAYHHKANHNQNRTVEQSGNFGNELAPTNNGTPPKVGFVSLGCPKALVDSERIITGLTNEGYQVANDYDGADLVVVNTCGFIESAVQESLDAIGEAINANGKVIVTGCLGKDAEKIKTMHPAVLAVTGAHAYDEVVTAVNTHAPIAPELSAKKDYDPKTDLIDAGIKLTPNHFAYLKISEGCNHKCTFCIIPDLRGKLDSTSIDKVMGEAKALQVSGVKELLVISQDTSAYGADLKFKTAFWDGMPIKSKFFDMCKTLARLGQAHDVWVRLHYVYPYPHVDKVVELMNATTKINNPDNNKEGVVLGGNGGLLPYLDIPLQHASPRVLKAMKRPAHSENTLERIQKWREICPTIVIRSTFVVGFPDETEEDFVYLLNWLKQARLDRVGCFTYSEVEGAKANALPNHVPEDIKQQRYERFMALQQQISVEKLQEKVGQTMRVVVDEVDAEEQIAICRSYADAPEIDGHVYVDSIPLSNNQTNNQEGNILNETKAVKVGDWLTVTIDEASEYDLFGSY